jgi:hypothetical protein
MMERQTDYLEGKNLTPLLIFPEGTVSSGRHILKLNKGAFYNLLPIKPIIVKSLNQDFDLSVGVSGLAMHLIRTFCYLWHDYEIMRLPIIQPNEFMFKNLYTDKAEKWEVYAEVVKDIYCEIGGFEKSEASLKEALEYEKLISGKSKKD